MSTPSELYRNAIDLNRYSNSVSKRIIRSYNDLLVDTCQRLAGLDAATAPVKAQRLTAILGQLKTGLTQWASESTALSIGELEELAGVQAGFVEEQLREALPESARDLVKSVEISPRFAEAVASFDPTQSGIISLSDDLQAAVSGASQAVRVTIADGVTLTLPNGQVLKSSFENMAEREAAAFGQAVRNGFLTGESTDSITRRLIGRLQEGDSGSISQLLRAGGAATVKANNQIRTVVRTSINQVANAASMKAYEANQDITKKYRYTATLDSRTSPICRALDGTEHPYGKGPIPPQHFNCRSTTVPIIDYKRLGFDPPPESEIGRPNSKKNIPDGETYGAWLKRQPKAVQEEVLGDKGQVGYFTALSKKYGPDGAIRRFVREDGSEKTIDDLKKAYGPVSKINAKPKPKPKPKPASKPKPAASDFLKPSKAELRAIEDWSENGFRSVRAEQFRRAEADGITLTRYEKAQTRRYEGSKKVDKNIELLEGYIAKAPKFDGVVYRGLNASTEDMNRILEALTEGKSVRALESWSKDPIIAKEFAIGTGNHLTFRVKNKKGADITQLSQMSGEREVLMPSNVRYRVDMVKRSEVSAQMTKDRLFAYEIFLVQLD